MTSFDSLTLPRLRRTLAVLGLAVFLVGFGVPLRAQEAEAEKTSFSGFVGKLNFSPPVVDRNAPMNVTADHMSADNATGVVLLSGNVKLTFGTIVLTSDRATYNRETGDVTAESNVKIVSETGDTWAGEKISFNHKTGEGLFGSGKLKAGPFTLLSDALVRDNLQVYHARNAVITSCQNPEGEWHWHVRGNARYKDQEFIELSDGVLSFYDTSILWAPYFYKDLNTHFGWRIRPGYSSKQGVYLNTAYVYPIAGNPNGAASIYGKTALDLRSEYGAAVGQELTWRTERFNQWGRLSLYYARHSLEDQDWDNLNWESPYDENRWSIALREYLEFSPRDRLTIRGERVSDSEFRADYKKLSVREESEPIGLMNYEHRENAWVTSLSVAGNLNVFYSGVRRLPELRLDVIPRNVFGIEKLYYESQTTLGSYERRAAKFEKAWDDRYRYAPGNWANYDTFRFATRHIFRRPFTLAEGVTLTPRAGWFGTYWTDSVGGGSLFRSLFEFGAKLQARYWKQYEEIRHDFIPYIDLSIVPGSHESTYDQPYAFDYLDREYEWIDRYQSNGLTPTHRYSGVRFGFLNTFQKEDLLNGYSHLFDFDFYGVFVLDSEDRWARWTRYAPPVNPSNWDAYPARRIKDETGLRVLGLSTTYTPTTNLAFTTDIEYDPETKHFAYANLTGKLKTDKVTYYLGYIKRNHDYYDYYWVDKSKTNLLYGGFVHEPFETFAWSLYVRWNLRDSEYEEIGGFLQYNLDCMSFRLSLAYEPEYLRIDNTKSEKDFSISFSVWLRGVQEAPEEDWMTWGNLQHERLVGEGKPDPILIRATDEEE